MYSYEIQTYISERHNSLTSKEYIFISDQMLSPQISHIKYDPFENTFNIWTSDNYHWNFKVTYEPQN